MKINKTYNQQWFTLIELLVVITIIGILATSGVGIYTTQMQWARDSVRVQNMKLLETSLHQYYSDNSKYPPITNASWATPIESMGFASADTTTATGTGETFAKVLEKYNSNYPKDPKAWISTCWNDAWYVTGAKTESWAPCLADYHEEADGSGLPHSAFKIATRLEKEVNVSSGGIAHTDNDSEWEKKINGRFEVFAGKWGKEITLAKLLYRIQ